MIQSNAYSTGENIYWKSKRNAFIKFSTILITLCNCPKRSTKGRFLCTSQLVIHNRGKSVLFLKLWIHFAMLPITYMSCKNKFVSEIVEISRRCTTVQLIILLQWKASVLGYKDWFRIRSLYLPDQVVSKSYARSGLEYTNLIKMSRNDSYSC